MDADEGGSGDQIGDEGIDRNCERLETFIIVREAAEIGSSVILGGRGGSLNSSAALPRVVAGGIERSGFREL